MSVAAQPLALLFSPHGQARTCPQFQARGLAPHLRAELEPPGGPCRISYPREATRTHLAESVWVRGDVGATRWRRLALWLRALAPRSAPGMRCSAREQRAPTVPAAGDIWTARTIRTIKVEGSRSSLGVGRLDKLDPCAQASRRRAAHGSEV